jgi:hypothetical protein
VGRSSSSSSSSSGGGGTSQECRATDFMQLGCAGEMKAARQGCQRPCAFNSVPSAAAI